MSCDPPTAAPDPYERGFVWLISTGAPIKNDTLVVVATVFEADLDDDNGD